MAEYFIYNNQGEREALVRSGVDLDRAIEAAAELRPRPLRRHKTIVTAAQLIRDLPHSDQVTYLLGETYPEKPKTANGYPMKMDRASARRHTNRNPYDARRR